ncbi:Choline transpo domain containing protein, partial [Asbolus verrucosus]
MTVITIIVTIFLISMFKRIPLVITIFKEAMKAIFAMPLIIFEPLLTFLAIFVAFLLFAVTLVYIITAGVLVKINDASYDYQYTPAMAFTIFFDILIFLWILKFIMGCQIMVISGAISTYYFSRDKSFLGSPIKTSFTNLIKHHLGSVALGSLILTISDILKALLKVLRTMHGENFFRSGRRATQLICQNLCDIIAINSLGDFVLTMTKLFIVVCTMLFALLLYTAIDTIFLCYCEDCQINDGEERPYYMSIELMQYIQESKSVMGPKSMAEA